MYHKAMETITASVLLISLLTIFGVDASRKRREFLQKQLSSFWQERVITKGTH